MKLNSEPHNLVIKPLGQINGRFSNMLTCCLYFSKYFQEYFKEKAGFKFKF